jgi:hypothetical protein
VNSVLGKVSAPIIRTEPLAQVAPAPQVRPPSRLPSSLPAKRKGSFIEVR